MIKGTYEIIRQCTVEGEETRSPETDNVASQQFRASPLLKTRGLHVRNFQQAWPFAAEGSIFLSTSLFPLAQSRSCVLI
jgi:hypothetical protein